MSTPDYTPEELDEINAMERQYGFPHMIVHAFEPELTKLQREHAQAWLKVANTRFGLELRNQLGRLPTAEELADRLALSLAIHGVRTTCSGPAREIDFLWTRSAAGVKMSHLGTRPTNEDCCHQDLAGLLDATP